MAVRDLRRSSPINPTQDFREFTEASLRRLVIVSVALTGNEHDAWDLVQDALVRVGRRWGRAELRDPMAYTSRVLVNLNNDRLRRRRREVLTDQIADSPVQIADDDGLNARLLDALSALTPSQRTAVALRYLNDMSIDDIAEVMQCAEGTVRSHLSTGTRQLRSILDPVSLREDTD